MAEGGGGGRGVPTNRHYPKHEVEGVLHIRTTNFLRCRVEYDGLYTGKLLVESETVNSIMMPISVYKRVTVNVTVTTLCSEMIEKVGSNT